MVKISGLTGMFSGDAHKIITFPINREQVRLGSGHAKVKGNRRKDKGGRIEGEKLRGLG
jgi:hypothetical protein